MYIKKIARANFVSLVLFVLFSVWHLPVLAADEELDWDTAPPSVIHQKLWEGKASALLDAKFSRSLEGLAEIANTQTNYDVLFYDINIRINDTNEFLYGKVRSVALAAQDGVAQVEVDFYYNMTIDSITHPSAGTLAYSRAGNVVTVDLDQSYDAGEQFEFTFYYNGHPVEGGFQAFNFTTYAGVKAISSLSEPYFARTWWPCKDRMDDKADSFNIAIIADTLFEVASNGTLDSIVDNGDNTNTTFYRVRYPMVSYLFSLAISDYAVWNDQWVYNGGNDTLPLTHFIFPSRYAYALTKYNITPYALTVLSEDFGPYPYPDEKYGHANFTWSGGMEHQTLTSMTYSDFGFSEPVVVHEMGHQWWGDMITCKTWGHIWLNEGWASYAEAVYYLAKNGWSGYRTYMNGMSYKSGGSIYITDTTSVWNIFGSIVYDKGAWVCHMLRGVLGDSLFYEGVNAYYNSPYKYGAATTEEFRDVFEAATGVELDWYFTQWIYGTYYPKYRYSYWTEPSDTAGHDLFLYVEQLQTSNPTVFTMPVDFYFNQGASGDSVVLWVDQRTKLFKLNFPAAITNVELDPSDWVLKDRTFTSWKFKVITFADELSEGVQYVAYLDTVETRGALGSTSLAVMSGQVPPGLSIDNNGIISGTPTDTGNFSFTFQFVDDGSGNYDVKTFTIHIAPAALVPGDVDLSGGVDIADIMYQVEWQFDYGPAPLEMNTADVNADCAVDIADLLYLVDYQFASGPAPLLGCVN